MVDHPLAGLYSFIYSGRMFCLQLHVRTVVLVWMVSANTLACVSKDLEENTAKTTSMNAMLTHVKTGRHVTIMSTATLARVLTVSVAQTVRPTTKTAHPGSDRCLAFSYTYLELQELSRL